MNKEKRYMNMALYSAAGALGWLGIAAKVKTPSVRNFAGWSAVAGIIISTGSWFMGWRASSDRLSKAAADAEEAESSYKEYVRLNQKAMSAMAHPYEMSDNDFHELMQKLKNFDLGEEFTF